MQFIILTLGYHHGEDNMNGWGNDATHSAFGNLYNEQEVEGNSGLESEAGVPGGVTSATAEPESFSCRLSSVEDAGLPGVGGGGREDTGVATVVEGGDDQVVQPRVEEVLEDVLSGE